MEVSGGRVPYWLQICIHDDSGAVIGWPLPCWTMTPWTQSNTWPSSPILFLISSSLTIYTQQPPTWLFSSPALPLLSHSQNSQTGRPWQTHYFCLHLSHRIHLQIPWFHPISPPSVLQRFNDSISRPLLTSLLWMSSPFTPPSSTREVLRSFHERAFN